MNNDKPQRTQRTQRKKKEENRTAEKRRENFTTAV
jgi:hypothetical protein